MPPTRNPDFNRAIVVANSEGVGMALGLSYPPGAVDDDGFADLLAAIDAAELAMVPDPAVPKPLRPVPWQAFAYNFVVQCHSSLNIPA